jgi:dual specificity protein phosphatase-like protein
MSYAILLPAAGVMAVTFALVGYPYGLGGAAVGLLVAAMWLGVALTAAGVLYGVSTWTHVHTGPWVKDGRGRGRLVWSIVLGPWLLVVWIGVLVGAAMKRGQAADEVADGLIVGRRPMRGDYGRLAPMGIGAALDLCAELPASKWLRRQVGEHYLSVPVMDITAATPAQLARAVGWVTEQMDAGRKVLIHCAAGYGRSAVVAVCVLMRRGDFDDPEEAFESIRRCRPGVVLNGLQRRAVEQFARAVGAESGSSG